MSLSKLQGECVCGNTDDRRFWVLRSPNNDEAIWGICCKKRTCQTEFLIADFCPEEADDKDPRQIIWEDVQLFKKNPLESENNHGFQASLRRVRVKKIKQLKKGDQITWSRRYLIWHHGVVTKVNSADFEVVHWTNVSQEIPIQTQSRIKRWTVSLKHKLRNRKLKIVKKSLTESDLERAFIIDHSDVYTNDRARDLTVSRAYSRLHVVENYNDDDDANPDGDRNDNENDSDNNYRLLRGNCEHFAKYCVRGRGVCFQNKWAGVVAFESVGARTGGTAVKAIAISAIEGLENATHASELLGALGVVVIEMISFSFDFYQLCTMFNNGKISRKVFYHEFIKHLTGSLCAITGGVLGGLAFCSNPALEILFAPLLGLLGKFGGMQLGSEIGLAITDKCIERDEKTVSDINSLNPGDHIVKTRLGGILRTHGIFVAFGESEGFIVAILFKKKRIVKLEFKFSGIRRIMYYGDEEIADPEDVISAAESLIADPAPRVRSRKRQVISCKLIPQN